MAIKNEKILNLIAISIAIKLTIYLKIIKGIGTLEYEKKHQCFKH